ncbi:hypothetical protein A2783_05840 [Microgenomates group bacterium RIFCSPHIGHO2_01_FULL_45_11]|nr:MAG: hypothetical protein A2783_05840 [Microgenomates group bacterium RIFCSPHIGHO2_01_FULL_45_11]
MVIAVNQQVGWLWWSLGRASRWYYERFLATIPPVETGPGIVQEEGGFAPKIQLWTDESLQQNAERITTELFEVAGAVGLERAELAGQTERAKEFLVDVPMISMITEEAVDAVIAGQSLKSAFLLAGGREVSIGHTSQLDKDRGLDHFVFGSWGTPFDFGGRYGEVMAVTHPRVITRTSSLVSKTDISGTTDEEYKTSIVRGSDYLEQMAVRAVIGYEDPAEFIGGETKPKLVISEDWREEFWSWRREAEVKVQGQIEAENVLAFVVRGSEEKEKLLEKLGKSKKQIPVYTQNELFGTDFPSEPNDLARMRWNFRRIVRGEPLLQSGEIELAHLNEIEEMIPEESVEEVVSDGQDDSFIGRLRLVVVNWSEFVWGLAGSVFQRYRTVISSKGKISVVSIDLATLEVWDLQQFFVTELKATSRSVFDRIQKGSLEAWYVEESGEPVLLVLRSRTSGLVTIKNRVGTAVSRKALDSVVTFLKNGYPDGLAMTKATGKQVGHVLLELGWQKNAEGRLVWQGRAASAWEIRTVINSVLSAGLSLILAGNILWHIFQPTGLLEAQLAARTIQKELAVEVVEVPVLKKEEATEEIVELVQDETIEAELETPPAPEVLEIFPEGQAQQEAIGELRQVDWGDGVADPHFYSTDGDPYDTIPDWVYDKILPKLDLDCQTTCSEAFHNLGVGGVIGGQIVYKDTYRPADLVDVSEEIKVASLDENDKIQSGGLPYLQAFIEELRANGYNNIIIRSAYRSYELQDQYYRQGKDTELVAPAGFSQHQSGLAFDIWEMDENFNLVKPLYNEEVLEIANKHGIVAPYSPDEDAEHYFILDVAYPGLTQIMKLQGIDPNSIENVNSVLLGMAQSYEYLSTKELTAVGKPESTADQLAGTTTVVVLDTRVPEEYKGNVNGDISGYASHPLQVGEGKLVWKQEEWLAVAPEDRFLPAGYTPNPETYTQIVNHYNIEDSRNLRYLANDNATFCNIWVGDVMAELGKPLPRWINGQKTYANMLSDWLADPNLGGAVGWREATAEEAQTVANQGMASLVVVKRQGEAGHMAPVIPETSTYQVQKDASGRVVDPVIANVGTTNGVGHLVSDHFRPTEQPKYYIHDGPTYEFVTSSEMASIKLGEGQQVIDLTEAISLLPGIARKGFFLPLFGGLATILSRLAMVRGVLGEVFLLVKVKKIEQEERLLEEGYIATIRNSLSSTFIDWRRTRSRTAYLRNSYNYQRQRFAPSSVAYIGSDKEELYKEYSQLARQNQPVRVFVNFWWQAIGSFSQALKTVPERINNIRSERIEDLIDTGRERERVGVGLPGRVGRIFQNFGRYFSEQFSFKQYDSLRLRWLLGPGVVVAYFNEVVLQQFFRIDLWQEVVARLPDFMVRFNPLANLSGMELSQFLARTALTWYGSLVTQSVVSFGISRLPDTGFLGQIKVILSRSERLVAIVVFGSALAFLTPLYQTLGAVPSMVWGYVVGGVLYGLGDVVDWFRDRGAGGQEELVRMMDEINGAVEGIYPGQVITVGEKHYKVTRVDSILKLEEVVPLYEERLSGSMGYPVSYLGKFSVGYDGESGKTYFLKDDGEEGVEIQESGLALTDGEVIFPKKEYRDVYFLKFTNELYNYRDRWFIRYREGGFFVDNEDKGQESSSLWMLNGQMQIGRSVEIKPGDKITSPSGETFIFSFDERGYSVETDPNVQEFLSDEENDYFAQKVQEYNSPELYSFIVEKLKEAGLPEPSRYNGLGLDTEQKIIKSGDIGFYDQPNDYFGEMFVEHRKESIIVRGAILEFLGRRDPRLQEIYRKYLRADVLGLIDRFDFGIKKLEQRGRELELTDAERDYLELIRKLKRMWEVVSEFSPSAESDIKAVLDSVDPLLYSQITQVLEELGRFNIDDPLVKSYITVPKSFGDYTITLPGLNQDARLFTLAKFADDALTRRLAPGDGLTKHQKLMSDFWKRVFEETGVFEPEWFEVFTYRGDEISFHPRAYARQESIMANAGGEYFVNEEMTEETFVHLLNHEATHPTVVQSASPRYSSKPELRQINPNPVQSEQRHNEIVVELLGQMAMEGRVDYPGKHDLTIYQAGVEELVKILREIDTNGGESRRGIRLLLQGVVDYNVGLVAYPLQHVYDFYASNLGDSKEFFDRLAPYEDSVYKFTSSLRRVEETNVLSLPQVIKNLVSFGGKSYGVRIEGGLLRLGEVGVRTESNVEEATERWLGEVGIDHGVFERMTDGQELFEFVSERLFDVGMRLSKPQLTLRAFTRVEGVSGQRVREFIKSLSKWREPLAGVFSSFAYRWFRNNGYEVVTRFDITNINGANAVATDQQRLMGDYLLRMVAGTVVAVLPNGYKLVRVSGDEFAVLAPVGSASVETQIQSALATAQSLYREGNRIVLRLVAVEFTDKLFPIEEDFEREVVTSGERRQKGGFDFEGAEAEYSERVEQLEQFHPEMIYFFNLMRGVGDLATRARLLVLLETMLYDDILQSRILEIEAACGCKLSIYKDRYDWVSGAHVHGENYRLLRVDFPGMLKRLNILGYEAGDDFLLDRFELLVTNLGRQGLTDIHLMRRGGEFYVAVPSDISIDLNELQQSVSTAFTYFNRAFTVMGVAAETSIDLVPAVEEGRALNQTNIERLNLTQDILAGKIWEGTAAALREMVGRGPSEEEWEFIESYLNPFDKRGILRLKRLGVGDEVIGRLQGFYQQTDAGYVVDSNQKEAARTEFIKLLTQKSTWLRWWEKVKEWWGREQRLNFIPPVFQQGIGRVEELVTGEKYLRVDRGKLNTSVEVIPESVRLLQEQLGISSDEGDRTAFSELDRQREAVGDKIQREEINSYDSVKPEPFHSENKKRYLEGRSRWQQIRDFLRKIQVSFQLWREGVQNSFQLVTLLDEVDSPSIGYGSHLRYEDLLGEVDRKVLTQPWLLKAVKRLQLLGVEQPYIAVLADPEIYPWIERLVAIPESTFDDFIDRWDKLPLFTQLRVITLRNLRRLIVEKDLEKPSVNADFVWLVTKAEIGLTDNEWETLASMQRAAQLNRLLSSQYSLRSAYSLYSFSQTLDDRLFLNDYAQLANDATLVLEEIARADLADEVKKAIGYRLDLSDYFSNRDASIASSIHTLAELFRAGFYLDADFNYENFYQISTATELIPLIRGVLQVADKPLTLSNYYRFSNFSLVDIFRAAADFSRLSPEAQERINEYLFQKISDQGLVPPGDVQDFLADNRNLADWMRYRVSEDAIEVMVALANRLKGVSLEQFATHTDHMRNVITVSQGSYSWFEQEQYRKDLSGFYPGWFVDAVEPLDLFDHYKRRGLRQFITWSETRANEYVTDVDTVSEQFISDVLNELSHSYDTDYINQLASLFITLRPFLPKSKLGTLALLIGGAAIDTKRVHQLVAQKEKILAVIGEDGSIDERLWQVMVEMDASVPFWFLALSSHYDFIAETWVTGPVYPIFYDLIEKDVDWQESWGWVNKLVVGDKYQAFGQLIREHYLSGNLLNKLSDQLIVEAVRKKVVGPNLLVEFADIRLEDQNLSAEERRYWQLISQLSYDVMKLKITYGSAWLDLISSFIENEEAIVGGDFTSLLPYATRQQWRTMFGDEVVTKLLQVLPEEGDERRNAFTHNEYDRMSALIRYLVDTKVIDRLDQRELSTLTEYIRMFGLSKASLLYYYFRHVYLFETGQISSLPQDIADSGITTVAEIKRRIDNLRQQIYSEASYVPPANMSFLELNILSVATGKSVHHFDQGLLSIDQIVNNYLSDLEMQSIVPLPHHYIASQIRVPKISVEATVLQSDAYELVRQEVLNSLSHTGDIGDLKDQITTVLQTKIEELTRAKQANIAAALFLQKQIDEYGAVLTQLGDVVSLDGLMKVLITVNFGKNSNEQTQLNSILRQIVIRKVLEKHQSPGHWDSLRALVEKDEMTIGSVTALDNLLKNHIKDHAINIQTGNSEEYWEQETFNTIVQNKKRNNLNDYVNPLIEEMKKLAATFEIKELEDSFAISLIPDRGFVGEMSAYLANVCYSKECPLLRGNPNVIPFKFVAESGGQKEFLGSTLVFEEYDAEGNRIMIIRAFDVPRDTEMAIGNFFELFVTHLEDIAKKRGVKEILVAGTTSTVSNYTLTTNYVLSRYGGETGSKVRPAHRFDFNGYDITNSLYLVRELPVSEDGLAVADFAQGVDEPTFIDRLVPLGGLGLADLAEFSLPAMVGVLAALYAGIPGLPITIMTLLRTVWTPTAVWKYVTDWWKGMFKPQSNLSQAAVIIQQESDFGVARWVDDAMNPETDCLGDTLQITWVGQAYAQEPETQTSGEGSTACPWWERRIAAVGNMAQRFLPFVVIVELTARYYKVIISVLWSPKIPQVEVTTDLFCEKEVFPSSVNAVLRKVGYNSFSSPLESCDRGCIKGMCTAKVNDSCSTEGQVFMRDDGGCLFECKGGVVTKTSSCDHVSVDSFSNELFHEAYSLLNTLPQHLFTGMEVRMNIYNDFRGTIGEGSGGFFKVDFVAVDGSYVKEDYAFYDGYFRHAIIHEFFHAFVDEGMEWVSVPLFPQLSTSFSHAVGFVLGTSIPRGYKNLTGCRAVGFLKYSYNMQPVTGNESESSKVSCEEDFVDSAAWYVTNACELRTQSPERYVYFRDEVFTDPKTGEVTEYLPVGGCAN